MTALNARIGPMVWLVRTHSEPHQLISVVTEQLRQASGGFPVARVRPMDEVVVHSTARQSFNMLLLSIFGVSALLLASIGIYGLMAYSVQQRTQEMGIRMALGADRKRIRSLVVWQGMQLAIAGVILGVCAAFGLTRLIASFLFGVKAWDPLVFVIVPITLAAVALLAVWLPATRSSRAGSDGSLARRLKDSGRAESWPAPRKPLDEQEQNALSGNSPAEINSNVLLVNWCG